MPMHARKVPWRRGAPPLACGLLAVALLGCVMPTLAPDGKLVWAPGAPRGASVLTASGVEFVDRIDRPSPVIRKSPYDPFRPATGFLVPSDLRWHRASQPVTFRAGPLAGTIRVSDALVPSWGGEIMLEIELSLPGGEGAMVAGRRRPGGQARGEVASGAALGSLPASPVTPDEGGPLRLALVVDDVSEATAGQVCEALAGLRGGDQVAIIDTRGPLLITPFLGYSHRSLIEGAFKRRVASHPPGAARRDLAGAQALARSLIDRDPAPEASSRVLVATDATTRRSLDPSLPAPRAPSLRELTLGVSSSPAPAHVIEATTGDRGASLDEDLLFVGDLAPGEARTEMIRVSVPVFVPDEGFRLSLRFSARDEATGEGVTSLQHLVLRYSDDVEALARERSGDVVAYAAALAAVRKLDRGLFGEVAEQPGGMRRLFDWQRSALSRLARDASDPSIERRARLLQSLAWSLD